MNFLDPYDITTASSSTPPPNQPEKSLNEEVNQVLGQLNSFWGGFKKQSQSAFEYARKDLTGVVSQAQKEFTRLTTDTPTDERGEGQSGTRSEDDAQPRASSETLKPPVSPVGEPSSSSAATSPSLLSRLQSALPPNVVSTVQQHTESLKHVAETTDFALLKTNLTSELQRLQGVTRAQAEEYVHKSEVLLRDAVREAGEVLKDAVKVIPPEASTSDRSTGLIWDGSDMWMLPSDTNDTIDNGKGKATAKSAVATRAEALLKRLKHDPEIIKHDPEADQGVRELYTAWLKSEYNENGGLETDHWSVKIESVLKDGEDGSALQATMDSVVPSLMSKEDFWKRYFFRVHQIQTEEEKRKALIQGTVESDEDFSWEDDDTEETTTQSDSKTTPTPPTIASTTTTKDSPPSQSHTPANISPRESSEDSYDLVSSGNVSASGEDKGTAKKPATTPESDEDGDSDWE